MMTIRQEDYTAAQGIAITKLCMALGIKEPLEEKPMTKGEAGRLIRELAAQCRAQRALYGSKHGLGRG